MTQIQTKTPIPRIPETLLGIAAQGYSLHVENVGVMEYPPAERSWARDDFHFYAAASRDGEGKAAGSAVVLLRDGEIIAEWPSGAAEKLLPSMKKPARAPAKLEPDPEFISEFFARAFVEWQEELHHTATGG